MFIKLLLILSTRCGYYYCQSISWLYIPNLVIEWIKNRNKWLAIFKSTVCLFWIIYASFSSIYSLSVSRSNLCESDHRVRNASHSWKSEIFMRDGNVCCFVRWRVKIIIVKWESDADKGGFWPTKQIRYETKRFILRFRPVSINCNSSSEPIVPSSHETKKKPRSRLILIKNIYYNIIVNTPRCKLNIINGNQISKWQRRVGEG